jgi:hypothetical protein
MANYGRDYTRGRYTQRGSGMGSGGYDYGYRGFNRGGWGSERGRDWSSGRGRDWSDVDRNYGWGRGDQFGGPRDFDESWNSTGPGWGRQEFSNDWDAPYRGFRTRPGRIGGYGRPEHGYMGSEGPARPGREEYDQDFGDRLRRGWNRFREEARDWIGRGYDRGW